MKGVRLPSKNGFYQRMPEIARIEGEVSIELEIASSLTGGILSVPQDA